MNNMITEQQSERINKILDYRRYRYYFDHLSDEFWRTKIPYKLDKFAIILNEGLFDVMVKTYLNKYENGRLEVMTESLAKTLIYFIGYIRYKEYPRIDSELSKLDEGSLEEIISLFKKEMKEGYIVVGNN